MADSSSRIASLVHAAVSESVELGEVGGQTLGCGIGERYPARALNREPVEWPDREVALSCPEWLLTRWSREYGEEAAKKIARAALEEPKTYFRGERVQDIGSQSVVPWLELKAGESFLDICAAPGNKTAQALETVSAGSGVGSAHASS